MHSKRSNQYISILFTTSLMFLPYGMRASASFLHARNTILSYAVIFVVACLWVVWVGCLRTWQYQLCHWGPFLHKNFGGICDVFEAGAVFVRELGELGAAEEELGGFISTSTQGQKGSDDGHFRSSRMTCPLSWTYKWWWWPCHTWSLVHFLTLVFEVHSYFWDAVRARELEGREGKVPLSFPNEWLEHASWAGRAGFTT